MGLKKLCLSHTISVLLWMLSFILLMVQFIRHDSSNSWNVLSFTPMWIGSAFGLTSAFLISTTVCKNAVLVSRERRMFMRLQGTESDLQFIDYDSLPLMRRLFFLNIITCISYLLTLTAQILFYLWLIPGTIGVWHALLPVCLLVSFYLIYMYVMKVFSFPACVAVSLLVLQLVLVTLKCGREWLPASATWSEVTIPAVLLLGMSGYYLCGVWVRVAQGRYVLSAVQTLCAALTSLSWLLGVCAVSAVARDELLCSDVHRCSTDSMFGRVPVLELWTAAIVLFVISGLVVLNVEGVRLAASRGFHDPIPLVQSTEGWVASSSEGFKSSLLLGRILTRPPQSLYHSSLRPHPSPPSSAAADSPSITDDLESSVTYYNAGLVAAASYQQHDALGISSGGGSERLAALLRSEIEMSPLK